MPVEVKALPCRIAYEGNDGCAHWAGHEVGDAEHTRAFLNGAVRYRAEDEPATGMFEDELRALATTDMAVDNLSQFLNDSVEREGWELGEAFAEVLLEQDTHRRVLWPWNNARDRKTPRASLPGADLVGFAFAGGDWNLLLGEVKTSSDSSCPPNVMYGKKGLTWQLETNALGKEIQRTLLRWLRMRCTTPETVSAYKTAVRRLLETGALLVVGILLRDTSPDARDVEGRARHLGSALAAPQRVEVLAWYLPIPIEEWPRVAGGTP